MAIAAPGQRPVSNYCNFIKRYGVRRFHEQVCGASSPHSVKQRIISELRALGVEFAVTA